MKLGPLGRWADQSPLLQPHSRPPAPGSLLLLPRRKSALMESTLTRELGSLGSCLSSTSSRLFIPETDNQLHLMRFTCLKPLRRGVYSRVAKDTSSGIRQALPLTSCVILNNLLNLDELWFPHL